MRVGIGMGDNYRAGVLVEVGEWTERLWRRISNIETQMASASDAERELLAGKRKAVQVILAAVLKIATLDDAKDVAIDSVKRVDGTGVQTVRSCEVVPDAL